MTRSSTALCLYFWVPAPVPSPFRHGRWVDSLGVWGPVVFALCYAPAVTAAARLGAHRASAGALFGVAGRGGRAGRGHGGRGALSSASGGGWGARATAVGDPGTLIYTRLGGALRDPGSAVLWIASAGLLVLSVGGWWAARLIRSRSGEVSAPGSR